MVSDARLTDLYVSCHRLFYWTEGGVPFQLAMGTATDRRSADSPPLRTRLGDAANVLLLVSRTNTTDQSACTDLLTTDATEPADVLYVVLEASATNRLMSWRRHVRTIPSTKTELISVGESTRPSSEMIPIDAGSREYLEEPTNLTDLGVTISDRLETGADTTVPTALCFDSLTALLEHIELDQVFRFLHALTGRVEATGTVAHYHMDPTAHDERAINTLSRLFDATVTVDEDGGWTVETR